MFWQGAYRGLHIDINPEFQTGDLDDAELEDLTDEVDEYIHGLRRFIRTQGVNIKELDVELGDPTGTYSMIMDLISGTAKIPKRILSGSERGELASAQDEINWNARIKERQEQFAEPQILRPFIDTLIEYGVLSEPKGGIYYADWPSLFELDELRIAQAAWTWGRAVEKFATGRDVRQIISPKEAREKMGLDPEKDPLEEDPIPPQETETTTVDTAPLTGDAPPAATEGEEYINADTETEIR
jgi:hypothetical protein